MKRYRIIIAAVVLFAVLVGSCAWMSLPTALPPDENLSEESIRVVLANIYCLNPQPAAVSNRLAQLQADILVVLEVSNDNIDFATLERTGLRSILFEPRPGTHGLSVFVDQELLASAAIVSAPAPGPCSMPMATARVDCRDSNIAVLGIHAPPPIAACKETTGPTLDAVASWINAGVLREDVGVAKAGDPVVLVGDFNAPPFSKHVRQFSEVGVKGSQESSRFRRVGTWSPSPFFPSAVRIDYILVPSRFSVLGSWVVGLPGSDHRAVVSDFAILRE